MSSLKKKNKNRRSNLKHRQKDFGVRFSLNATWERKMRKVESGYYHVIYILNIYVNFKNIRSNFTYLYPFGIYSF